MGNYKLISADSHIIEPADLWKERIDPKYRDRAPYVVSEEDSDQWYVDGDLKFGFFGVTFQAGLRFDTPELIGHEGRLEDIPPGGLDPHEHVKDMDLDGVSAGVVYPTQALNTFMVLPDSDLLSAICRGYNDWVADFCKPHPDRLKAIGMLNVDDIGDAVGELQRAAKIGLAGVLMTIQPMEKRYDHPDYEPLWAAAQDLDMVLSLHSGSVRWKKGMTATVATHGDPVLSVQKDYYPRTCLTSMILSGVFERFPKLKVGIVEFELAWAPFFIRSMDNVYTERVSGLRGYRFKGSALPSDFVKSNVFFSFQEDDLGIQMRSAIGVDNLLWGSDYPHAESTFPKSREIVDRIMQGVPKEEVTKIVCGNAARVYNFN